MFERFLIFALNQLRTLLITVQRYYILYYHPNKTNTFCIANYIFFMDDKLERLQKAVDALKYLGVFKTQQDAANQMLMSRPNFSAALNGSEKYFTEKFLDRFLSVFGNTISSDWLLTGEGEMLVNNSVNSSNTSVPASPPSSIEEETKRVPLIPFEARGGQLDGFARNGVTLAQCETVPTPFKGAQFAISVRGQSMSPTYPSGCVLFISKNIADWVEWGKVYVLDTENGVIVKQLAPSSLGNDFVCCKSFNDAPEFAPFDVPKSTIFGIYRVVGALIET